MKDEEMADKYAESLTKDWSDGEYSFDLNDIRQAFLAGLKAGRPQWHDLRKDPKDLPDEGTYLVVWQNARGYRETMIMCYEEDDEEELHWTDVEGDWWDNDVIAWREIPKFEEAAE